MENSEISTAKVTLGAHFTGNSIRKLPLNKDLKDLLLDIDDNPESSSEKFEEMQKKFSLWFQENGIDSRAVTNIRVAIKRNFGKFKIINLHNKGYKNNP